MYNKLTSLSLVFCVISALFATSCSKTSSPDPVNPTSETVTTVIFGTVTDETNRPLAGVTVNINAQTVRTDAQGIFSSQGVSVTKKTVLKANYNGYFQSLHLLDLANRKTTNVQIKLQKKVQTTSFSSSTGGTATIGNTGASVIFPVNGYKTVSTDQPYTGNVVVYARFANIDSENFIQTVPGTMTATDANGVDSRLRTFGMMEVLMTDASGNALQLNNSTATISMPVATSQASTAPNAMPLWSLDETTAIWKQEGTATKQGNAYVGTVSHFTWWNCDIAQPVADRAAIKGRVIRMVNGVATPVGGVYIYSTLGGGGQNESDGTFGVITPASVTSGTPLTISFSPDSFSQFCLGYAFTNVNVNIPALSVGQLYDMGDIDVSSFFSSQILAITGNINLCDGTSTQNLAYIYFYDANDYLISRSSTDNTGAFSTLLCGQPFRAEVRHAFGEKKTITNITSNNLGTITLDCVNKVNDNEYTIDGDGFSNQRIVYNGIFYNGSDLPYASEMQGQQYYNIRMNADSLTVPIAGTSANSWGTPVPVYSGLFTGLNIGNLRNKSYTPVSGTTVITNHTATEIQGTYSGVVRNTQTNVTANITAGKFRARKR